MRNMMTLNLGVCMVCTFRVYYGISLAFTHLNTAIKNFVRRRRWLFGFTSHSQICSHACIYQLDRRISGPDFLLHKMVHLDYIDVAAECVHREGPPITRAPEEGAFLPSRCMLFVSCKLFSLFYIPRQSSSTLQLWYQQVFHKTILHTK